MGFWLAMGGELTTATLDDLVDIPGGAGRERPPVLTSCFRTEAPGRPTSTLGFFAFSAFALLSSTIHAGWLLGVVAGFGLEDSGCLSAASSHEDFVGLHLLGSMVFEGLWGIESSASGSSLVEF